MKLISNVILWLIKTTAFLVIFIPGWVIKYAVLIVLGFILAFFFNR